MCQANPPDGVAIDITGAAHLQGGEVSLLSDLTARLRSVGIGGRGVIGPTLGAAHAVARFRTDQTIIGDDGIDAALAPLPLEALRLPADLPAGLRRMGFERIGDIAHRPRAPLQLRFGAALGRRLDQAYGRSGEPLIPVEAPETPRVEKVFAEPIGAPETLARYAGALAEALCGQLETRGLGARRLDWLCFRVDNRIEAVRIGLAQPIRDAQRLARLLTDKIETIEPGFGIERMTLAASAAEPLKWRHAAAGLGAEAAPDVSILVDTLSNRIGAERLYRLAPVESDVPERSTRKVAPMAAPTGTAWTPDWPRPTRLFRRPEPIETMALLPDNPPTHFNLARRPPSGPPGRRPGTDLRRMGTPRRRDVGRPRLLPGRGRCWRTLLAFPRGRRRGRHDGLAGLVHPRAVWLTAPASAPWPTQTRRQTVATHGAFSAHHPHDLFGMVIGHTHPGAGQGSEQHIAEVLATGVANLRRKKQVHCGQDLKRFETPRGNLGGLSFVDQRADAQSVGAGQGRGLTIV